MSAAVVSDANMPTNPAVVNKVPDATATGHIPYDYIVVATKNCPDIKPGVPEIIAPAVTKGHSVIVLVQNGLNIEKPLIAAFPENHILSGVSLMGVSERGHGTIVHDYHDSLFVGAFKNPGLDKAAGLAAAQDFVDVYGASGKVTCELQPDVDFVRWRKLIYNTAFNSVAAIARMDTSRMRIAKTPVDDLIRPAMQEVFATAKAAGVDLPPDIIETTINIDPIEVWSKPSMLQDAQKVSYLRARTINKRHADSTGQRDRVRQHCGGAGKGSREAGRANTDTQGHPGLVQGVAVADNGGKGPRHSSRGCSASINVREITMNNSLNRSEYDASDA